MKSSLRLDVTLLSPSDVLDTLAAHYVFAKLLTNRKMTSSKPLFSAVRDYLGRSEVPPGQSWRPVRQSSPWSSGPPCLDSIETENKVLNLVFKVKLKTISLSWSVL